MRQYTFFFLMALALIFPDFAWAQEGNGSFFDEFFASQLAVILGDLLSECWTCSLINIVFLKGTVFAVGFYEAIAPSVLAILVIVFATYVLFQMGRVFMPFGSMLDTSGWNNLLWRFVLLMIISTVLADSGVYWHWFVAPIVSAGVGMTQVLMTDGHFYTEPLFEDLKQIPYVGCGPDIFNQMDYSLDNVPGGYRVALESIRQPWGVMICSVAQLHGIFGQLIGTMFAGALVAAADGADPITALLNAFGVLINVIFAFIPIVLMVLVLVFYAITVLDIALRTVYLGISSPFMFAGYLFEATRGLFKETIWGLVRSAFNLFFVTLGLMIGLNLFAVSIQKYYEPANLRTEMEVSTAPFVELVMDYGAGLEDEYNFIERAGFRVTSWFAKRRLIPGLTATVSKEHCTESYGENGSDLNDGYLNILQKAASQNCLKHYTVGAVGYWWMIGASILTLILMRISRQYSDTIVDSVAQGAGKAGANLAGQAAGQLTKTAGAGVSTIGGGAVGLATGGVGLMMQAKHLNAMRKGNKNLANLIKQDK